jgi:nitrite reductase/ring-hydroxylating ferredoxin subunit
MAKKPKGADQTAAPAQPTPAAPEPPAAPAPAGPEAKASAIPGPELTRRDLLSRAGTWALVACGAGATVGCLRFALPETTEGQPRRFPLGTPADFKARTITWLREHELFVVRDDRGFGAFSSKCTHLGCTVRRTAEGFSCPCHGAKYDLLGQVLSGPARRALPWYTLWQEPDGRIWVDLGRPAGSGPVPLAPPAKDRA